MYLLFTKVYSASLLEKNIHSLRFPSGPNLFFIKLDIIL